MIPLVLRTEAKRIATNFLYILPLVFHLRGFSFTFTVINGSDRRNRILIFFNIPKLFTSHTQMVLTEWLADQ